MEKFVRSSWSGYGIALLSVALTLAMLVAIPPLQQQPFFLFTTAVMVSAWYGGLKPGLLATVLSVAAVDFFFLHPTWSWATGLAELFQLIVFSLLAVFISTINGKRLRALDELRQAEAELRQRVNERTATLGELSSANTTLAAQLREHLTRERQAIARIERINEMLPDMIFINRDNQIRYINQAGLKMLGVESAAQLLGQSPFDLIHPDYHAAFRERIQRLHETREVVEPLEEKIIRLDGELVDVEMIAFPFDDPEGPAIQVVMRNITRRKQAEQALRESEERFLRAQRLESLGTLAGGIAHDLNNIFAPMLMTVNMLQREWTDEKSLRRLEVLRRNALRGSEMVKQVLTFARGSKGEHVALLPAPLLQESLKLLNETLPKTITIDAAIPDDLWPLTGDATQLHQVVLNLCVNARDAMPHGGALRITAENLRLDETWASLRPNAQAGPYLRLTVADTGEGIPAAILDKIFDPFFTTKDIGSGTGLGLSTVHGIVKGHGGFVEVESKPGQGTRFCIYLPADAAAPLPQAKATTHTLRRGNDELILIVDDEAAVRETVQDMLTSSGYRALTACDGTEALTLYSAHQHDIRVVLLDLNMPHLDGLSTLRALHKINPALKVIISSGMPDNASDETLREHSAAFLPKPYSDEKLLHLLTTVLERQAEMMA